jgi:hypothetical protein
MKSLQKELKQFAQLLKQKGMTLGFSLPMWGSAWGFSSERCSAICR